MSLNTLETAYVNGQVIDASHINELTLSLLGQFVGRDANGVPTPNQSLGTLAIPWGNVYANGLILNGLAVDTSQITSLPNRVVSGQTRNLSSMPDFIRANGAALEFDILGATTELILSINNTAVSISSDLNKTGVISAPSTNNTADINDTDIVNDLYAGETDYSIKEILIDAVGSEITSRIGQIVAFRTPTGEIFQGLLKSGTRITDVYRGFYFDSSGNPIERGNLSNNDTITLMNIGWVFVEDNGSTVDVSYRTPSISYNAPSSPLTGDYWFDITNQVWKRYSGTTFEIINRILVGQVVSDDTNTIASRSIDFSNQYRQLNNIETTIDTSEIALSHRLSSRCSIYGTELQIDLNKLSWNITTDLETGLIESSDTVYFLYLSDEGQEIISDQRPYERKDLKGFYHPYHSYRCVATIYNDASSDFYLIDSLKYLDVKPHKEVNIRDEKSTGTAGGTATGGIWNTRDLNTVAKKELNDFAGVSSNQVELIEGVYSFYAEGATFGSSITTSFLRVQNITKAITEIFGPNAYLQTANLMSNATLSGTIVVSGFAKYELQHRIGNTVATNGFGLALGLAGRPEIYATIKIVKIG